MHVSLKLKQKLPESRPDSKFEDPVTGKRGDLLAAILEGIRDLRRELCNVLHFGGQLIHFIFHCPEVNSHFLDCFSGSDELKSI